MQTCFAIHTLAVFLLTWVELFVTFTLLLSTSMQGPCQHQGAVYFTVCVDHCVFEREATILGKTPSVNSNISKSIPCNQSGDSAERVNVECGPRTEVSEID
jgi:hypothetical protein